MSAMLPRQMSISKIDEKEIGATRVAVFEPTLDTRKSLEIPCSRVAFTQALGEAYWFGCHKPVEALIKAERRSRNWVLAESDRFVALRGKRLGEHFQFFRCPDFSP